MPKVILVRMLGNALLDALIGVVPIAGRVADIFWRANSVNLALLERHARPGLPLRERLLFVFAIVAVFGMLVIVPVVLAIGMPLCSAAAGWSGLR